MSYQIIKTISGRKFWEEGYESDVCEGMPSSVPRWFVDLRSAGKLRINCLTQATLYLRNDGRLFHIQTVYHIPAPLSDSVGGSREEAWAFLDGVYQLENVKTKDGVWECCEYIPDSTCYELDNIWRVAAAARRSGRYLYAAKRQTAKTYIETDSDLTPWIYASSYDQFTPVYEARYEKKVRQVAEERKAREEYRRKHAARVEFNIGGESVRAAEFVDHFEMLGIQKNASPSEIKRAYWAKAKCCHPDLHPQNANAEEEFKKLNASYSELMRAY